MDNALYISWRPLKGGQFTVSQAMDAATLTDDRSHPARTRDGLAGDGSRRTRAAVSRRRAAAPSPAVPRTALGRPAVLAVAAPTSSFSTPAPLVAVPEALPSAQASGVVAAATAPTVFEPPRFNAAYLANPPPPYPASARRRGIEGEVFINAWVGVGGEARELKLATSSGDTALDTAAMDAVRGWRFVLARRVEQAVEAWVRIPLVFRLN